MNSVKDILEPDYQFDPNDVAVVAEYNGKSNNLLIRCERLECEKSKFAIKKYTKAKYYIANVEGDGIRDKVRLLSEYDPVKKNPLPDKSHYTILIFNMLSNFLVEFRFKNEIALLKKKENEEDRKNEYMVYRRRFISELSHRFNITNKIPKEYKEHKKINKLDNYIDSRKTILNRKFNLNISGLTYTKLETIKLINDSYNFIKKIFELLKTIDFNDRKQLKKLKLCNNYGYLISKLEEYTDLYIIIKYYNEKKFK